MIVCPKCKRTLIGTVKKSGPYGVEEKYNCFCGFMRIEYYKPRRMDTNEVCYPMH